MYGRWSLKNTFKFIEEYEKHECLWNFCNKYYKNQQIRSAAYQEMSNAMDIYGFTARNVIAKIRIIRNTYTLELNKIARKKLAGNTSYKPSLPWFQTAHRFLGTVINIRQGKHPNQIHPVVSEVLEIEDPSLKEDEHEDSNSLEPHYQACEEFVYQNFPEQLSFPEDESQCSSRQSIKQEPLCYQELQEQLDAPLNDDHLETMDSRMKTQPEVSRSTYQVAKEDEFDFFGRSIASQLRNMPLRKALLLQARIQTMVVKLRLQTEDMRLPEGHEGVRVSD